jgi:hypothetical protein
MSSNDTHHSTNDQQDTVEAITHFMPVVLPIAGGVLMLLLAFIAIFVA